jgi:glycosyltransferase involved in cell wall biosynthesis
LPGRGWNPTRSGFNYVALLQNENNSKLARTRNAGFSFADSEFVLPLDADNALLPNCIAECLAVLEQSGAAMAYPTIEQFGDRTGIIGEAEWNAGLLQNGNYIDAMALIRKECWLAVGGYDPLDLGWEDYDFWCKMIEAGLFGVRVPVLTARYRVHARSMLNTVTDVAENIPVVMASVMDRHPWISLRQPHPRAPGAAPAAGRMRFLKDKLWGGPRAGI